jgi:circadian clock protein KaiC
MSQDADSPAPPARIPTGIRGLDRVLGGGLFKGGIYIVTGYPGAGKTTFGNQVCFRYVADGGRASYVTLLSETHARMLFQIQTMSFYRPAAVGNSLVYLNGFTAIESEGLDGLLKTVRRVVRDHAAGLLVLDGMVTAGTLASSSTDYKKFINELQTWVGVVGCTVLFLTSARNEAISQPEHSMVDGIFDLQSRPCGLQMERQLTVTKFRGSAFVEGVHAYRISADGVVVFPRLEALRGAGRRAVIDPKDRASTGDRGLDRLCGGGLARGSSTLLLGPAGSGKTTLGLQFLAAGLEEGEAGVHLGCFEPTADIYARADALGLPLRRAGARFTASWASPLESIPDQLAEELLDRVRATKARRVVIDGLFAVRAADRLAPFVAALTDALAEEGATTVLTDESVPEGPGPGVPTVVDNLFLFQGEAAERTIAVAKARQSDHQRRPERYQLDRKGLRVKAAKARR